MKKDIVVIGAGPAGLSFARSLAGTDLKIGMIEKRSRKELADPPFDGRDIALTHLSARLLRQLDIWTRVPEQEISAIYEARVLDGDSPRVLQFDQHRHSDAPLGYLISNHLIRKGACEEVCELPNVELWTDTAVTSVRADAAGASVELADGRRVEASLIVAADSRFSASRRMMAIPADMKDFGRVVIVCRMRHERPNRGIAYECFHYGRTLAVLPVAPQESSIVITVPTWRAHELMEADEKLFAADVQQRFRSRLGSMELSTERFSYPLVAVHADRFVRARYALVGDAAVGMHPVTAHGFNLGLRGADLLARLIRSARARGEDIGALPLLERYESGHRRVTRPLYLGTNAIVALYTNDAPLPRILRKAVMHFGNRFPPVKRAIVHQLTDVQAYRHNPVPVQNS